MLLHQPGHCRHYPDFHMEFAERERFHVNRCRAGQQQHALAGKGIQHPYF